MKTITSILLVFLSSSLMGQTTIDGVTLGKDKLPVIGANIYIDGSYDGAISDVDGSFSFTTSLEGEQTLIITLLGYETKKITSDVSKLRGLNIKLRESAQSLDAVEISASTFKAGDNSKVAVLKPLDMVTTAGSNGDVIAAMQNLPGTQANAEDGRLFVRGGDARETKIYVDGLRVFSPYTRTVSGTPSRGRFSPFLFSGVSFSTGGYSAAFGQALSGVLDMKTIDEPAETATNISLMTVGLGLGHTQKWGNHSVSANVSYIDLTIYNEIIKPRLDINQPYHGFSGEAIYRYKTDKGLLKFYIASDNNEVEVQQLNLDTQENNVINITNGNYYANTSYSQILDDRHTLYAGISAGYNNDELNIDGSDFNTKLSGIHNRVAMKSIINDHFIINYGLDHMFQQDEIAKQELNSPTRYTDKIDRSIFGAFSEVDYFFTKNMAIQIGLRAEHNTLNNQSEINPRITLAQKVSKNGQVSAAIGRFSQELNSNLLYNDNLELVSETATHYLLNYNYKTKKQILRLETYYKKYNNLAKYSVEDGVFNNVTNLGDGYAYGFDMFWRGNALIKNTDFWISYSWINTERNYKNYPESATPSHITDHNISLVGKRWIQKLKSQLSLTYQFATGRPYENPNTSGFMNETSKNFNSMSASWAYLISQQKILFFSVSNVFNYKNEYGYRYASTPDPTGVYPGEIIRPNADSFLFLGFFMTISSNKDKNQLDNL